MSSLNDASEGSGSGRRRVWRGRIGLPLWSLFLHNHQIGIYRAGMKTLKVIYQTSDIRSRFKSYDAVKRSSISVTYGVRVVERWGPQHRRRRSFVFGWIARESDVIRPSSYSAAPLATTTLAWAAWARYPTNPGAGGCDAPVVQNVKEGRNQLNKTEINLLLACHLPRNGLS